MKAEASKFFVKIKHWDIIFLENFFNIVESLTAGRNQTCHNTSFNKNFRDIGKREKGICAKNRFIGIMFLISGFKKG